MGGKKMKKLSENLRKLRNIFCYKTIQDEILEIPREVKRQTYSLVMSVLGMFFAFMLKLTNSLLAEKLIILGIMCFCLYQAQKLIDESLYYLSNDTRTKSSELYQKNIAVKASQVIIKVQNTVLKYDEKDGYYHAFSNEKVMNTIQRYLNRAWSRQAGLIFNYLTIITVTIMIAVTIATNTSIPQPIFIPILLVFITSNAILSTYKSKRRNKLYSFESKTEVEKNILINDVLRIPPIVESDNRMRINRLEKTLEEYSKERIETNQKVGIVEILQRLIGLIVNYGIIGVLFYSIYPNINGNTITEVIATITIIEAIYSRVNSAIRVVDNVVDDINLMEIERPDMELIMERYNNPVEVVKKEEMNVSPFCISYKQKENELSFSLRLEQHINMKKGDIFILRGPSGAGKSTFLDLITGRMKQKMENEIPKYLIFNEKLVFGSLSLYDEMFCDETPDFPKIQEILKGLNLWDEILKQSGDVWEWLRLHDSKAPSNGQKQRLLIAKILYWLDDEDFVLLDEPTSGLDEKADDYNESNATAAKIMNFIIEYINKDRKRIVIIATHQDLADLKYTVKNLYFIRKGNESKIIFE